MPTFARPVQGLALLLPAPHLISFPWLDTLLLAGYAEGESLAKDLNPGVVETLLRKINELIEGMEKAALAEHIELYRRPRRLLFINFWAGLMRGFGIAVGFSVVGSIFLIGLGRLASLNLPVIGRFIAEIVRIVHETLTLRQI